MNARSASARKLLVKGPSDRPESVAAVDHGQARSSVLEPATLHGQFARLQRFAGNRVASRSLQQHRPLPPSNRAISRYFTHQPQSGDVKGATFEAQERKKGDRSFVDDKTKKTTIAEPSTKTPQLRVADDGRIAVESSDLSTRQSKVFFASPDIVSESNARLLETGSEYQLFIDKPDVLTVPNSSGDRNVSLARVLPRNVQSFDEGSKSYKNQGLTMDIRATCDEVAQAIVRTGNIGDFPVLKKSLKTAVGFGELNVARYLLARHEGNDAQASIEIAEKGLELDSSHDAELKSRTDAKLGAIDDEIKHQRWNMIAQHLPLPSDEESKRLRGQAIERAREGVRIQMETELKASIADAYGKLLATQPDLVHQLSAELGLNREAQPEIGQAFGSILMQGKTKNMDHSAGKARTHEEGGVWGSHYGAVVAKSGGDMITLENYARNRENEGISEATEQMYYFQMYGSAKGQTWHETWAQSERRVINPLTQVFGQSYRDVWVAQLNSVPKLGTVGDTSEYAVALANHQKAIEKTGNRTDAMAAYKSGLLDLVRRRFLRYSDKALTVAEEAGVVDPLKEFKYSYSIVRPALDGWINAAGSRSSGSGLKRMFSRPKNDGAVFVAALAQLRTAIDETVSYYGDRFPGEGVIESVGPPGRKPAAPNSLSPKKQAQLDAKVKKYFAQDRTGRYSELKSRHAHYEGENLDASNNPTIAEGREGVKKLRAMGMKDDAIRDQIKKLFPAYTATEIDTYFLATGKAKVTYLDSQQRADYELAVVGGRLKQRNKDYDTSGMFSSGAGAGYSIFVMGPDGLLYANEHKPGLFHHSSFLAGMPSAAAGELQVKKGTLKVLTNKSGHYHPGARQTKQVVNELQDRGISPGSYSLKVAGIPAGNPDSKFNGDYSKARKFLDLIEGKK